MEWYLPEFVRYCVKFYRDLCTKMDLHLDNFILYIKILEVFCITEI